MSLIPAILLAISCAAAGALLAWLWARAAAAAHRAAQVRDAERLVEMENRFNAAKNDQQAIEARVSEREARLVEKDQFIHERDRLVADLRVSEARALSEVQGQSAQLGRLRDELIAAQTNREVLVNEQQRLTAALARVETALHNEKASAIEKLAVLNDAREQLTHQFRSLANDILEEKSKHFTEQNKVSLGHLLDPLKTQLTDFKGTVERVYVDEGEKRVALSEQVKQLAALNAQLSSDAIGLTNALKGSSKTQGNWGEVVLERILESGGLRKGHEYRVQENHTREDGTRVIPDVILQLPEGRHLVIDAKVSLTDYNDHVNAATDEHREVAGKRHVASLHGHFRGLSEKDYRSLHTLNTVDFVIMFVPIEPAFMVGISRDPNLLSQAWERNVLLVSPSTLLFVIRTISYMWKQELQRDNVKEIARQGGLLYDKFSDFVADLSKLGEQLRKTQDSYDSAFNKLKSGKGNLINRAQALHKMGVKALKPIPQKLVEEAAESAGDGDDILASPILLDLAASADSDLADANTAPQAFTNHSVSRPSAGPSQ